MVELHTNCAAVERGKLSAGGLRRLAGEPVEPESALALAPQDAGERRQQDGQLAFQGPGRVDQDQTAAVEAGRIGKRGDEKFGAQYFRDAEPAQGLGQRVGFGAALDRVPERIDAGRPFAVRCGKPAARRKKSPSSSKGGSTSTRPRRSFGGT